MAAESQAFNLMIDLQGHRAVLVTHFSTGSSRFRISFHLDQKKHTSLCPRPCCPGAKVEAVVTMAEIINIKV